MSSWCRTACASGQSNQHICYLLIRKNHISTCYKRNSNILASLCSYADWVESYSVENPKDRFSSNMAHMEDILYPFAILSNPGMPQYATFSSVNIIKHQHFVVMQKRAYVDLQEHNSITKTGVWK